MRKWISRKSRSLLSAGVAALAVISAGRAEGAEIFEFYTGARQLGMGGAYVAVVNDETALLTNPAGLGKLRDFFLTVADPEVHWGSTNTEIVNMSNYSDAMSVSGLQTRLTSHPGTHFHAKAQVFPSFVLPNFGVGAHVKYAIDAEVSEDSSTFRLDYTNDYAVALGYNFRLWNGIIKLGFNVKAIDRVEIAEDLDPAQTGYTVESLAAEGVGLSTDVGLILAAPVRFLPTIAAVVHDVGHTRFNLSDGMVYSTTVRPREVSQKIDVGIALFPIISKYVRAAITAEVRDVQTLSEETDQMRRYHAGIEFNVADFMFLRGGMNQRYWTGGLEFASEHFQLQAASYGEEIGTATTPREDRRYVGKIAIRF